MSLTELFCAVDDFCQVFLPAWQGTLLSPGRRQRAFTLTPSEVMTIIIHFHHSHYRNFKHYYLEQVSRGLRWAFPRLVSYQRFVELMPSVLIPLCAYLQSRRVTSGGIAFVDSLPLKVCHNRRIPRHRTFVEVAERGKNSVDWYYGFKLHLIIDDRGELVSFFVTPGNVDDRQPLKHLCRGLKGKLFGDKGYLSQALRAALWEQGLELFTKLRRNMKPVDIGEFDKLVLRKRSLIETVNDQLKNISQLEHTRHRSLANFMVNLVAGLVAYSWQPKKPSLKLRSTQGSQELTLVAV